MAYDWYISFCNSTFLDPDCLLKASYHPVISKLMHHFYLQHPPSCEHFDPWDVEHVLSLLESWALASSLTTFQLAWKTATLLAFVNVKCFSDYLYYVLIISTFFFSIILLYSFLCLVAWQIIWVIFLFRFILRLIPVLIFALFFYLEAYF